MCICYRTENFCSTMGFLHMIQIRYSFEGIYYITNQKAPILVTLKTGKLGS